MLCAATQDWPTLLRMSQGSGGGTLGLSPLPPAPANPPLPAAPPRPEAPPLPLDPPLAHVGHGAQIVLEIRVQSAVAYSSAAQTLQGAQIVSLR